MIELLQSFIWERLAGKIDRLPHALLLHGPLGVGKLALAERFAQYLLCEKRSANPQPCGRCEGCRWFVGGNHPDLRLVEPEAMARRVANEEMDEEGGEGKKDRKPSVQIRIEQTRALAAFVNLGSHRGAHRIAIVHPAEDMNSSTANSLLKMLEEPPQGAVFLLVSHRPGLLLPTIRSRCVPVPVSVPDPGAAANWIAAQGVQHPERWLAFAGGAPRRALEYAKGESGEAIEKVLRSLAAGDRLALANTRGREDLEPLAEVLQKMALDRAFAALAGRTKYGGAVVPGDGRAWLAYARALGEDRLLTRHPLNPRLFATQLVAGMPKD